mmetsp:Transcript_87495/g.155185  ORF Transcript_87495/g.155185 Transcript_87495/m.155185 type:complete len:488 (+) Transcript_87495:89-1552(+)|eukprot:CAMPEP_0197660182 /NCGR_PEP_ID=MMETSP1338-20131121/50689_1 /TAXON_ID=43686 ORGANISM="Pelagodinium beii, Strain RCC1491" /NCGR_SAMPLE_ID=MMETSP1338 /ASSEMBLY_ACC=CAM_ASM_000754 /LENGTH=487 /DNA_ID=CAMNT_0043237479 /DNA_START=29 /DNA_END=1492 /DNA_ORIENTATION=+
MSDAGVREEWPEMASEPNPCDRSSSEEGEPLQRGYSSNQCPKAPVSPTLPLSPIARPEARTVVAFFRHAERADSDWTNEWSLSEDSQKYPCDPPITSAGIQEARASAKSLNWTKEQVGGILASPYLRCVQTALVMAEELDTNVELDHRLGEILSRKICGDLPLEVPPWRSREDLLSALENMEPSGHHLQTFRLRSETARGQPPSWPESEPAAACRYGSRFVTHLLRSSRSNQNFLCVSHGESIKACVELMPETCMLRINTLGFCGAIIAELVARKSRKQLAWKVSLRGVECQQDPDFSHATYLRRLNSIHTHLGWTHSKIVKTIGQFQSNQLSSIHEQQSSMEGIAQDCGPERAKNGIENLDDTHFDQRGTIGLRPDFNINTLTAWSDRREVSTESVDSLVSPLSATSAFDKAGKLFKAQQTSRLKSSSVPPKLSECLPQTNGLMMKRRSRSLLDATSDSVEASSESPWITRPVEGSESTNPEGSFM